MADYLLQLGMLRANKLRMAEDHAHEDLLGNVEAAEVRQREPPPLPHGRMHELQAGCSCRGCRLVLRPGKEHPEVTEVLAQPKEFQPRGSVDPGRREGEGRTEREAVVFVDDQLAIVGRAE